jgi:phosphomannomutase
LASQEDAAEKPNADQFKPRPLNPRCVREYDIRGVVDQTLSADDARLIGRAYGTLVAASGGRKVCVGYDGRISSPAFEQAAVAGLSASGIDVLRVGLGPSPMLYHAVHAYSADGGVMITGSHNPPDHNGIKFMLGTGSFYGADILRLALLCETGPFVAGHGRIENVSAMPRYIARIAHDAPEAGSGLKIAWDAGNGSAGPVMAALTAELPGDHVLLNAEVDGTFPNHHPDPSVPANLAQLIDTVRDQGCDFGVAFDGDGDRLGVVDGRGRPLSGDRLLMLLAREVLAERPGAAVVSDVKASEALFDEVRRLGGTPVMWRTGHSPIKAKMRETGAALAGDVSGHVFFADKYYGFDDGLYAAVRLFDVVARSGQSLAELADELPDTVITPEFRFPCADRDKFGVVERIHRRLIEIGADMTDIDGVRVRTSDGWWLLRASNTEDALTARAEAFDRSGLERLKRQIADCIEACGLKAPIF